MGKTKNCRVLLLLLLLSVAANATITVYTETGGAGGFDDVAAKCQAKGGGQYLATPVTEAHWAEIQSQLGTITNYNEMAWLGGKFISAEGVWKWVHGPLGAANGNTGTVFYNQTSQTCTCGYSCKFRYEPASVNNDCVYVRKEPDGSIRAPGITGIYSFYAYACQDDVALSPLPCVNDLNCTDANIVAICNNNGLSVNISAADNSCYCTCDPLYTGTFCDACSSANETYPACVTVDTDLGSSTSNSQASSSVYNTDPAPAAVSDVRYRVASLQQDFVAGNSSNNPRAAHRTDGWQYYTSYSDGLQDAANTPVTWRDAWGSCMNFPGWGSGDNCGAVLPPLTATATCATMHPPAAASFVKASYTFQQPYSTAFVAAEAFRPYPPDSCNQGDSTAFTVFLVRNPTDGGTRNETELFRSNVVPCEAAPFNASTTINDVRAGDMIFVLVDKKGEAGFDGTYADLVVMASCSEDPCANHWCDQTAKYQCAGNPQCAFLDEPVFCCSSSSNCTLPHASVTALDARCATNASFRFYSNSLPNCASLNCNHGTPQVVSSAGGSSVCGCYCEAGFEGSNCHRNSSSLSPQDGPSSASSSASAAAGPAAIASYSTASSGSVPASSGSVNLVASSSSSSPRGAGAGAGARYRVASFQHDYIDIGQSAVVSRGELRRDGWEYYTSATGNAQTVNDSPARWMTPLCLGLNGWGSGDNCGGVVAPQSHGTCAAIHPPEAMTFAKVEYSFQQDYNSVSVDVEAFRPYEPGSPCNNGDSTALTVYFSRYISYQNYEVTQLFYSSNVPCIGTPFSGSTTISSVSTNGHASAGKNDRLTIVLDKKVDAHYDSTHVDLVISASCSSDPCTNEWCSTTTTAQYCDWNLPSECVMPSQPVFCCSTGATCDPSSPNSLGIGSSCYPCMNAYKDVHCNGHATSVIGDATCLCVCEPFFAGQNCQLCNTSSRTWPNCVDADPSSAPPQLWGTQLLFVLLLGMAGVIFF